MHSSLLTEPDLTPKLPLAAVDERADVLFPRRVPEPVEAMTAEEYESFSAWQAMPAGRALYAGIAAQLLRTLALPSGARVLSIGEGEGALCAAVAKLRPDLHVTGTDVAIEAIAEAARRYRAPNLSFRMASAYDVAGLGRFDAVICVFALHHFHEPASALRAMARAVAPGGQLYLMDLRRDANAGAYFRRLDDYVGLGALTMARLFRQSVRAAHTLAEVEALLAGAGQLEVRPVRWDDELLGPVSEVDPIAPAYWGPLCKDVGGLWVEATLRPRS